VVTLAVATKLAGLNPNPMLTLPAMSPAVFSAHLDGVSVLVLAGLRTGNRLRNSLFMVLLVGAVFAAFTRITIGAMFIGFSVILFLALGGVARVALPMVGLLGLPALFLFSERFKDRMFYGSENLSGVNVISDPAYALEHLHGSGRFSAWAQFLKIFFDPSPFVGSGLGATQHYFYTHSVTGLGVMHSEYVRLLCEVGVVGLGLFGLTACAYFVRLIRTYRSSVNSDTAKYTLAAIGGLVVYLIFIATDNGFDYVSQFGIYVFAFIGMSEKARELEEGEPVSRWSVQDSNGDAMALEGKRTEETREYPIVSG
jgi:O-antigen ligase